MAEPLTLTAAAGYCALAAAAAAGLVAVDAPRRFLKEVSEAGRDLAQSVDALYFPTAYKVYDIDARNAVLDRYVAELNAANILRRDAARWFTAMGDAIETINLNSPVGGTPSGKGPGSGIEIILVGAMAVVSVITPWTQQNDSSTHHRKALDRPANLDEPMSDGVDEVLDAINVDHLIQAQSQMQRMCEAIINQWVEGAVRDKGSWNLHKQIFHDNFAKAMHEFLKNEDLSNCRLPSEPSIEMCHGITLIGGMITELRSNPNIINERNAEFLSLLAYLLKLFGNDLGVAFLSLNVSGANVIINFLMKNGMRHFLCQNGDAQ